MKNLSSADRKMLFQKAQRRVTTIDIDGCFRAKKIGLSFRLLDCVFFENNKGDKFILSDNCNIFDLPCGIVEYLYDRKMGFICKNKFLLYQRNNGFREYNLPVGYSFVFKQFPAKEDVDAYTKKGDEWMYSFNSSGDVYRVCTQRFGDLIVIEKEGLKALFSLKSWKILVDGIEGEIYTDRERTYKSPKTPCDDEYRNFIVYLNNGERYERDL